MKARRIGVALLIVTLLTLAISPRSVTLRARSNSITYASSVWIHRTPAVSPLPLKNHKMAYDSTRNVTILFGGDDGTQLVSDTWEWDGEIWTLRTPPARPVARYFHAMAYDSTRNVVVLFGGRTSAINDPILGDTWEWDGTTWTERTPLTSPPARWIHAMAYDSARGVVVLFGGSGNCGGACDDTWEWDGTTWTQRTPSTSPPFRWGHSMAYDSMRGVTILFGGRNFTDLGDTWEWDGIIWVQRFPSSGPSDLDTASLVYDDARGVSILFGGYRDGQGYVADTWEWNGTLWTNTTSVTSPTPRDSMDMAYDSAREVCVMFGGYDGSIRLADTWEYTLLDSSGYLPILLVPFGPLPGEELQHSIYRYP